MYEDIKKPLTDKLIDQFNYYNFELTSQANEMINDIVDVVSEGIRTGDRDDLVDKDFYDDMLDDLREFLPSDTECYRIVNKALMNDVSHFEYITNEYGLDMTGTSCICAEWWYNILPEIINFIVDFVLKYQ